MQLLMGVQGITADVSPNALVQEAAKGNVEKVGAILARNPSQVTLNKQPCQYIFVYSYIINIYILYIFFFYGCKNYFLEIWL